MQRSTKCRPSQEEHLCSTRQVLLLRVEVELAILGRTGLMFLNVFFGT